MDRIESLTKRCVELLGEGATEEQIEIFFMGANAQQDYHVKSKKHLYCTCVLSTFYIEEDQHICFTCNKPMR